jgi:hypothetical protein
MKGIELYVHYEILIFIILCDLKEQINIFFEK